MTPRETRYFFDTEFIEDGVTIELLSIGIVTEDGSRELYLENVCADWSRADDWVKKNVLTKLQPRLLNDPVQQTPTMIARAIRAFVDPAKYGEPSFWAFYADYDWVVLCQLYGKMIDLPDGWPKYCLDVKQQLTLYHPGVRLPELGEHYAHNALEDAKHLRECWHKLGLAPKP